MKRLFLAGAAFAAISLSGCAQTSTYVPSADDDVPVTREVMDYFKQYEAEIGSTHPGAFAISVSGRNASYRYCPEMVCASGSRYGQKAIKRCETYGEACYLFADGDRILYKYHVIN